MTTVYVAVAVRVDVYGRMRVVQRLSEVLYDLSRAKMQAMDLMYKMNGPRVAGVWAVTAETSESAYSVHAGIRTAQAMQAQTLLIDEAQVWITKAREGLADVRPSPASPASPATSAMAGDLDFERVKKQAESAANSDGHRRAADLDPETGRPHAVHMYLASSTIRATAQPGAETRPNIAAADLMGFPAGMSPDGGRGVRVAVVGSGNAVRHGRDGDGVRPTIDCTGADLGESDVHGWGTHAVSMLVGWACIEWDTRVAGGVEVIPIRVLDEATDSVPDGWLRLGIDTARRLGCQVILIGGTSQDDLPESADAIRRAVQAGALVVAPAGDSTIPGSPARWPANMPEVIAVGCADEKGDPEWWSCSPGDLGVYAVGIDIWGSVTKYEVAQNSGTAVAAVWVAAAAALIYERWRVVHGEWPRPTDVAAMMRTHSTYPSEEQSAVMGRGGVLAVQSILSSIDRMEAPEQDDVGDDQEQSGQPAPGQAVTGYQVSEGATSINFDGSIDLWRNACAVLEGWAKHATPGETFTVKRV